MSTHMPLAWARLTVTAKTYCRFRLMFSMRCKGSRIWMLRVSLMLWQTEAEYRWISSGGRFPGSHEFEASLSNIRVDYLRPEIEWPEKPRTSRVHADPAEWTKVVFAPHGVMLLNGAMAVDKVKNIGGVERKLQRFISIFTPVNDYFDHVLQDDQLLPYIGQLTTIALDSGEVILIDSEDLESCFNLFKLPRVWLLFFAFSETVPGWALGRPDLE
eukprot:5347821-Amphidinium_carterae.1